MSRGGRGGLAGGAGRMGGKDLPFTVDADLEDQVLAYHNEMNDEEEWTKTLYPPMNIFHAPPPTAREKRLVSALREYRNAARNGPYFIDSPAAGKRDLAEFNAFEDVATYSNKRAKPTGGLPNLKKLPIVKSLLPRELWDLCDDDDEENGTTEGEAPKKNLNFLKKKRLDKLAQFDDDADDAAAADKDDDDEVNENEDGGEDEVEELRDDDFSEDDDDLGNDYNAEKYFDDGDGADDDGDGGDGGGGEDAW
ncbi:uncharacterized protein SEPMUDRAFT_150147 [Sphaerulina musiva SO2202]|uniref:DNA-directed RNA polymerase III subunit n=1 Tax=Sphaerulina musiva (strain SO2202) TaxID=692275 RepID=M3AWL4_SPHMS|nr:uncharacterized protein SEPMUDRAFT_150147 [Sphaerulina musiva SO2202]EMF11135.1 hypothetical protein SEPMUDRAFT_150147 [Sphaerulina musiva SO2202]